MTTPVADPHAGQPVLRLGPRPQDAGLSAILIHGRGASAEDILSLAREFATTDVAYLAPQAAGNTWYPSWFLSPIPERTLADVGAPHRRRARPVARRRGCGLGARGAILGFSQGACLTLEFAARNPRRYAALIGLSGGLIGPSGTPRVYTGSLDGTPAFLGVQRRRCTHSRRPRARIDSRVADDEGGS